MNRKRLAGLAAAILAAGAMPILLMQIAERWKPAAGGWRLADVTLWLLAWGCLALVTVILGKAKAVTPTGAGGVTVLCISLGAVLKASGAPAAAGASLVVIVCFVVMTAAAAGFQKSARSRDLVTASVFWLLGATLLAGATWECVFGE